MGNTNEREQQEYEFVMEGITTRMQIALEKQSASVRWVCIVMLVTVLLIISGFIVFNQMWLKHVNHVRETIVSEVVTDAGAEYAQAIPESGS